MSQLTHNTIVLCALLLCVNSLLTVVRERHVSYSYQSYSQKYHQLFGVPMVVKMPKKCTYRELYAAIYQRYGNALTPWSEAKQQTTEPGIQTKFYDCDNTFDVSRYNH